MPHEDVRHFLRALEERGDLTRVSANVDLHLEVGAICRKALDRRGPALWFEQPGAKPFPLVTGTLATRERIALALDTTPDQLQGHWLERGQARFKPATVQAAEAPCKERIRLGDDVDLSEIPVPQWNELDGGPFITLAACFSQDPGTGARNVGIYRAQVHSRDTVGLQGPAYRHVFLHARSALEAGEPFPVALVMGLDPVIALAAAAGLPAGEDELELAAALRQGPVETVPCETIPIEVPARAEFVLEGELLPGVQEEEGPFGDVTGYYSVRRPQPVVRVKAITHRSDAIHVAAYTGRPPSENALIVAVQNEGEVLRTVPLPGIRRINVSEGGCGGFNCIVSIEKAFEGQGRMIGLAILGTWAARPIKNLIVVDDDVDPFDWNQVEWALATRFQPARDMEVLTGINGHGLDPSIDVSERRKGTALTSKVIIDATRFNAAGYEKECGPGDAMTRKVEENWDKYGIRIDRR
jgi:UbiD family decarboxylase